MATQAKINSTYAQYVNKTNQILFESNTNNLPSKQSNVNDSLDKQFHSNSKYLSHTTKYVSGTDKGNETLEKKASCVQLL